MTELSETQCNELMRNGEFGPDVLGAAPRVAVVLTQGWCPQWAYLRSKLEGLREEGLGIFFVEYDQKPFFREFMGYKERILGNDQVPYLRYYRDGALVSSSNYVGLREFLAHLDRPAAPSQK